MARPWSDAPALYSELAEQVGEAIVDGAKTAAVFYEARIKRRLSGEVLRYRSGALRRSVRVTLDPDGADTLIRGKAGGGPERVRYARIHELGGVIRPKRKKILAWKLPDGTWAIARQVTMPKRPYMRPSAEEAMVVLRRAVRENLGRLG